MSVSCYTVLETFKTNSFILVCVYLIHCASKIGGVFKANLLSDKKDIGYMHKYLLSFCNIAI